MIQCCGVGMAQVPWGLACAVCGTVLGVTSMKGVQPLYPVPPYQRMTQATLDALRTWFQTQDAILGADYDAQS